MGIAKLTKTGKAIQFIDDEGWVYQTSATYMRALANGNLNKDFIVLHRLPQKVSSARFPKSPVWNPGGLPEDMKNDEPDQTDDAYADRSRSKREQKSRFQDKVVW